MHGNASAWYIEVLRPCISIANFRLNHSAFPNHPNQRGSHPAHVPYRKRRSVSTKCLIRCISKRYRSLERHSVPTSAHIGHRSSFLCRLKLWLPWQTDIIAEKHCEQMIAPLRLSVETLGSGYHHDAWRTRYNRNCKKAVTRVVVVHVSRQLTYINRSSTVSFWGNSWKDISQLA